MAAQVRAANEDIARDMLDMLLKADDLYVEFGAKGKRGHAWLYEAEPDDHGETWVAGFHNGKKENEDRFPDAEKALQWLLGNVAFL